MSNKEKAEAVFSLVSRGNAPEEIKYWLEEIAQVCLDHIAYVAEVPEEELTDTDQALLSIMEPYLFLLGAARANHWIDRMDEEEH